MTVESATYISDLNASNPAAGDPKAEGDDHIRLVKSTIKATFPNVTGAVSATHTRINYLTSAGGTTGTTSSNLVFSASPTFTGTVTAAAANFSGAVAVTGDFTLNSTVASLSASAPAYSLKLDSTGNFGFSLSAPSAWNSDYRGVEIGAFTGLYGRVATNTMGLVLNAYRDSGGTWRYRNSDTAARVDLDAGTVFVYIAASGTAGNAISWTQALSVTAAAGATRINVGTLPTSSAGLASGELWNNAGTIKVV